MQKKRLSNSTILDKLHRGAVLTCLGITLYGTYLVGMRIYRYYNVIKPERQKAELQQLLAEGSQDMAKEIKC